MPTKRPNLSALLHLNTLLWAILSSLLTTTSISLLPRFAILATTNAPLTQAFTCGDCNRAECHIESKCPGPMVLDPCDCCPVCAKVAGEECGGHHYLHGKCAEDLVCVITPGKGALVTLMEVGTCTDIQPIDNSTLPSSSQPPVHDKGEFVVNAPNNRHDEKKPLINCSLVNCEALSSSAAASVHRASPTFTPCPLDSYSYTPPSKKTSTDSFSSFFPASSLSSSSSSASSSSSSSLLLPSSALSSLTHKAKSVIKFKDLFRYCCDPSNNHKKTHEKETVFQDIESEYKGDFDLKNPLSNGHNKKHNNDDDDDTKSLRSNTQMEIHDETSHCRCYPCPLQQPLKCPADKLPHLVALGNLRPGTCCPLYECLDTEEVCKTILCNDGESERETCPDDSLEIPLDSLLDVCCFKRKGCQCKPESACRGSELRCPDGMVRRVLEVARGVPGACCNRYDCLNVTLVGSSNCAYKNLTKKAGDKWIDGCMQYHCKAGIVIDSNVPCPDDQEMRAGSLKCDWMGFEGNDSCCAVCKGCVGEEGSFYSNGESWRPHDCMECRCQGGQKYCQAESCQSQCSNPVTVPGTCCPVCDQNDSFVKFNETCDNLNDCKLMCRHGYREDASGCPRCECQEGGGGGGGGGRGGGGGGGGTDDDGRGGEGGAQATEDDVDNDGNDNGGGADDDGGKDDEEIDEDSIPPEGCELECATGFMRDKKSGKKRCMCRVVIVKNDEDAAEKQKVNDVVDEYKDEKEDFDIKNNIQIIHKEDDRKENKDVTKTGKERKKASHIERCSSLEACHLECIYGYQKDLEGCATCHCNRCPQFECHKRCRDGYQTNNDNCLICKCLHSGPFPALPLAPSLPSPPPLPLLPHHKTILDGVMMGRHCVSTNERRLEHGQAWWDGCRRCFCHRGYEMCELVTCPPVQCSSPVLLPDQCCLTCPGKDAPPMMEKSSMCLSGEGRLLVEGETWSLDECTFCLCHQGTPLCTIEMCAPLLCHHPIILPHSCCPVCPHSLDYLNTALLPTDTTNFQHNLPPSTSHSLGNNSCTSSKTGVSSKHGDVWKVSACQSCYCRNGVIHCFSQTCPILGCHRTVLKKGHCCPSCLDSSVHYCEYNHETYDNRESWMVDDCTTCACMDGHVMCTMSICAPPQCASPVKQPGMCCPVCSGNSKPGCGSNKAKKDSSQHLNISLIVVLIAIIAILAIAIVVLLIMLLWLKPRLRRSSSLNIPNPFFIFNTHRRDHVPLNDEKSVSSSFLPLNSVSTNTHTNPNGQPTPSHNTQQTLIKFQASNHTTPKLGGRSSVDGGFDAPSLSAAISSMTTASLASSSSSAAKKRLSSLDGCSGSDEKAIPSETSREDITKPPNLPSHLSTPSSLPPLPPRRPQIFHERPDEPSYGADRRVPANEALHGDDKNDGDDEGGDESGGDGDGEEDEMLPPPIPPNHPDEVAARTKCDWHSDLLEPDQARKLLDNNHDDKNLNNSYNNNSNNNSNNNNNINHHHHKHDRKSNHNNRKSW